MPNRTYPFLAFLLLVFLSLHVNAQEIYCETDAKMEKHHLIHPLHKKNLQESFRNFSNNSTNFKRSGKSSKTIPVHVIVVHKPRQPIGELHNLPNKIIEDQIEALNRDFNRENGDSTNTPLQFSRANMDVVFCLAKTDPFGQSTDGISRYSTSLPFEANEFTIKESSGWPREDYLNIWITELDGKLGYTYIPSLTSLPDEILDGVVLDYRVVGNGIANPRFGLGRVAVHEVGHYLGLQHIFGAPGCEDDDGIEDTPKQDTAHYGCKVHPIVSCGNAGDMFMNYMDYTDDSCKNAFTQLQVDYMDAILNSVRLSVTLSGRAPECSRIPPLLITGSAVKMPKCAGDKTGSLEIFTQGGKAPYRYFLNDTEYFSQVINDLNGGIYRVRVIDAVGNIDSARYTVFEPDSVKIRLEEFAYSGCTQLTDSLTVKVNAKGGLVNVMGYNFSLNNNTNRTGRYTKVGSGKQIFYVLDLNGCKDSLILDIPPKTYLDTIPTMVQYPTCRGDIDGKIQVIQPNPSFQYFIDNKSVKDGMLNLLNPGIYQMKVISDQLGCIYQKNIQIIDPPLLTINDVDIRQMPCILPDTGKIIVFASGGLGQKQYSIDSTWKNSNIFQGVGTGIFDVRVRDGNGCVVKYNRTVAVTQVGGMFTTFESFDAFCSDNTSGRILMTATGGSGSYNYYINGNSTSRDTRNLKPGIYNVTVEDRVSRCLQNRTLVIGTQAPMTVNIQQTIINPNNTVQIIFAVMGGLPPYLYSVDNGASYKSVPIFDQLPAGNYTITVLDNNNCRIDVPIRLTNTMNEELAPVLLFPNPFYNKISLQLPNYIELPIMITVLDINGVIINQQVADQYDVSVENLEEIPTGIYLLQIQNTTFEKTYKIVKRE
jgi:hypothetical protein